LIMKKIIKGLIALGCAIGLLIPSVVNASWVCDYACDYCNFQNDYRVSYFDEGNWVTENVIAWNARAAAEDLGLRAGRDCFVGFDKVNRDPVMYDFKVSFLGEDGWTVEYVQAESKRDAAALFGMTVGYDCWVTKVL
jgi:hypothetical protein